MKGPWLRAAAAALLLAGWHLALRRHGHGLPLNIDEGEYSYAARVWDSGRLPYRDAFSPKPPIVLALYRACLAFSGRPDAPRALAAFFSLATMALLWATAPASWSAGARAAPAAAYAALSTLPVGDYGFVANAEVFLCGFTALAAWAVRRGWDAPQDRGARWAALAGLACGAAVMTKQTAGYTALAFGVLAAWAGPRCWSGRRAAAFALAGCLVPAGWLAYFAARGGLTPFLDAAFRGNMSYVSIVGVDNLLKQGRWLLLWLGPALLKGFWPALALGLWGLGAAQAAWAGRLGVLAALWLGTAAAGVMTGLFFFPHYFLQAAPALSLCAGLGAQRLARRFGARAAVAAAAALALLPAAGYASLYASVSGPALARRLLYPNPLYEARAIAEYAASRTRLEDFIYVFGSEPQIYVYAGRRGATPHPTAYALTLLSAKPGQIEEELALLRERRPKLVVYIAQPFSTLISTRQGWRFREEIKAWLSRDYRWTGEAEIGPQDSRLDLGRPEFSGRSPEWNAENRIFVFERD